MTQSTSQYEDTLLRLIKLTRRGKLQWRELGPLASLDAPNVQGASTYEADLKGVTFRLDPSLDLLSGPNRARHASGMLFLQPNYQLTVVKEGAVQVTTPPLQTANDLVKVIHNQKEGNLSEINRLLDEELEG